MRDYYNLGNERHSRWAPANANIYDADYHGRRSPVQAPRYDNVDTSRRENVHVVDSDDSDSSNPPRMQSRFRSYSNHADSDDGYGDRRKVRFDETMKQDRKKGRRPPSSEMSVHRRGSREKVRRSSQEHRHEHKAHDPVVHFHPDRQRSVNLENTKFRTTLSSQRRDSREVENNGPQSEPAAEEPLTAQRGSIILSQWTNRGDDPQPPNTPQAETHHENSEPEVNGILSHGITAEPEEELENGGMAEASGSRTG